MIIKGKDNQNRHLNRELFIGPSDLTNNYGGMGLFEISKIVLQFKNPILMKLYNTEYEPILEKMSVYVCTQTQQGNILKSFSGNYYKLSIELEIL